MKKGLIKAGLLACTALTFVLTSHTPAEAGPLFGIVAGIFGAIASGASIAQIVIGVALKVGMTLLQMALTPEQQVKPVGVKLQVEVGDDKPVSAVIGTFATSGKRKYIGSYGDIGGTPNSHLTEVIEVSSIPVGGLSGLWMDGQKCTILYDEPSSRGYPLEEYRVTKGSTKTDYAWIQFYDGTQTAADSYMLGKFGDHDKRPWTASMVGRGCAYAVMTYRWKRDLFRGQPSVAFELLSIPLYDIRKDSTNGGSGDHRWSDPSTWEPSVNMAVMAYNVARGLYYKGEWFYGGQNVAAHRLPSSAWIAAAQECSRLIDNADGSRSAQFRGGFEITGDAQPIDTLDELRKGMNARLVDSAGALKIKVGAMGAAVYAFTDADIIVTEDQGLDPFPTLDQTINAVYATYPEPDEQWAGKDAPALRDPALEARDGKLLPASIQYRAVPYQRQVQRLMRAALKEERRFRTHQIWLPPEAYALEPGIDVVAWTSEHNGYDAKKFLVVEIAGDPTMNQLVTLQEVDPSDYDWSSDFEMPSSTGWLGRIDAPDQPMDVWAASPSSVQDANGIGRRPAILVSYAGDLDDVESVWVRVRVKATGDVVYSLRHPYDPDRPSALVHGGWCLPVTHYEVTGKYVPYSNRSTSWAGWIEVLTDDIRYSTSDLFMDEVSSSIRKDVVEMEAWLWESQSLRSVIDTAKALATSIAEQDLANFADKQQIRRELTSLTASMSASFTEQITVATSATAALASQVTTINAALAGIGGASGLASLVTTVNQQGSNLSAQATQITNINASLDTKASSDAVSALSTAVSQQGSTLTAQGQSLNSLTSQVGDLSADARIRFETYSTGVSGYAKIGLQARVGNGDDYRTAGFWSYVPVDPGTPTRFVVNAGQFAVSAGVDEIGSSVFLVDGSGVYMDSAYIRNISTDKITFNDGSVQTSALAQQAAVYLNAQAVVDSFTVTTVFANRVQADVTKTDVDAVMIFADCRVYCTDLGGAASAALLYEIWEVENGGANVSIAQGRMMFQEVGTNGTQTGMLFYQRKSGSGSYIYKLVLKKLLSAPTFFVGRCTISPLVLKKGN